MQQIQKANTQIQLIPEKIKEQALISLTTSPRQYYEELQIRTIEDAVNSPTHQISGIKKHLGETQVRAILTLMISDVVKFLNLGNSMGADQVVQTVKMILEDYYFYRIEDFKLCFTNAKKGHYGEFYNRIDGQVIFGWLKKYEVERNELISKNAIKRHNKHKEDAEKFVTLNDLIKTEGSEGFLAILDELNQKIAARHKVLNDAALEAKAIKDRFEKEGPADLIASQLTQNRKEGEV
jgi:hypothetical protein